jgi:predicted nucleic acid-binding protein
VRAVVDASVVVKWILPDADREPDLDRAVEVLEGVRSGRLLPLQPPHWIVEVAAVITRLRPEIAVRSIRLLDAMELPIDRDVDTLNRAIEMAAALGAHVFDTLYHAVALANDGTLITSDERYLRRARHLGRIVALHSFPEAVTGLD